MDDLTPPQYGEHQFDQLYSDIDPSGYMTPAGGASGMGTPFQSRSRSVSAENLASMDGIAYNDFAASVLQTRLSNLDVVRSNRIARDRAARDPSQLSTLCDGTAEQSSPETMRTDDGPAPSISLPNGDYFEHSGGNTSGTVSRRVSEEDEPPSGPVTPQHIEYSAESLAKVPSYTTAIQSQARMPINDGLPTYQTATRLRTHSPPMRQPPTQAHVHRVSGGV